MQDTLLAEPSEEMLEAEVHTYSHIVREHREGAGLRFVAILLVNGRPDQGLEAFRQALRIDADYSDALFGLASALEEAGRRAEAQRYWREYVRRVPDGDDADYARGRIATMGP